MLFLLIIIVAIGYFFFSGKKKTQEEQLKELEKIEFPENFSWSLLIAILAFNLFAYAITYGLGTGLFNFFLVAAIFLTFPPQKRTPVVWALSVMSIIAGFGIAYRANGFVQSVDGVVVFLSNAFLTFLHAFPKVSWSGLWLIKQVFLSIGRFFRQLGLLFRQSQHPELKKKSTVATFIKTAIITMIVLLFFVGLLSNADPVFSEIIKDFRDEAIGRAVASLFFAVFFSAALSIVAKSDTSREETQLSFLSFQDIFVSVSSVVLLFALFLVIQGKYLFGSHQDLASFGLTYSEYVRKGFLELLIASFFGILLSYVVILKKYVLAAEDQKQKLTMLNGVFLLELFFMIASALKRDLMYMDVYGLTRVRMIGGIFLFWLSGFLILVFLLAVWKKMQEKYVLSGILALSCAVVLFLNLVNIDAVIVRALPGHHDFKDWFYINSLSEDAIDGWLQSVPAARTTFDRLKMKPVLTEVEKTELANAKLALIALQENRQDLEKKYGDEAEVRAKYFQGMKEIPSYYRPERKWQAYNFMQYEAYKKIGNTTTLSVNEVDTLLAEIRDYQRAQKVDLYDQEWKLMRGLSYPFVSTSLRYYPDRMGMDQGTYNRLYRSPSPTPVPSQRPVQY